MTDEPFSALLEAAFQLHEMFEAYTRAGFTEDQSMDLTKAVLIAMTTNQQGESQ
jgi:hypothetical protein